MVGHRSGAGEPEPGTAGQAGELRGAQRGVGGRPPRCSCPPGGSQPAGRRRAAARPARRPRAGRAAPRSWPAGARPTTAPPSAIRLAVPIPPFHSKQTMPVPAPTAPWATASERRGVGQRAAGVRRLDLDHARVVQPAVVAFRHHRDHHVVDAHRGLGLDGRRHGAVVDAPHRHRRGQVDRRLEHGPTRGSACEPVISPAPLSTATPARDRLVPRACRARPGGSPSRRSGRRRGRPAGRARRGPRSRGPRARRPRPRSSTLGPGSSAPMRRPCSRRLRARVHTGGPYLRLRSRRGTRDAGRLERPPPPARPRRRGLGGRAHARHRGAGRARSGFASGWRTSGARLVDARAAARRRASRACTTRRSSTTSRAHGTDWEAAGLTEDPGQDRVVPYLFPAPGAVRATATQPRTARPRSRPAPGQFAYDTMTLIGPGTWEAARAALDTRGDRRRPGARRRARRLRLLPPARPPRDPHLLRRLLLPQQLGRRGRAAARRRDAAPSP